MITRTLPLKLCRTPVQSCAALALLLSASAVSAQSQLDPAASPDYAALGQLAQASPAQVQHTQAQRSGGGVPQPTEYQAGSGSSSASPIAQPPAIRNSQGEQTNASAEAEAANRDMQAELEPTPGGLTSEEVIRQAFDNSPQLAKASLDVNRTSANQARAQLAFAPRFDVGAGYQRLSKVHLPPFNLGPLVSPYAKAAHDQAIEQTQGTAPGPNQQYTDPVIPAGGSPFNPFLNVWSVTASVQVPISDIFLTIIPTYKMTKKLAKVADFQRESQKLQISYDARVAYYEYARLRGNASVARASVRVREAGVRDLEALVQAGTATQTELVRAQAELATARTVETQAQGGVEVAIARIEQLTGTPLDRARGIGEPFIGIDIGQTPSIEQVRNEAKGARPELLAYNALVEARELNVRAKKGALLPKLNARGDMLYGKPNPRYVPPVNEWKLTGSAGITIGWSPNDTALAYTQTQDAEWDMKTVLEDKRAFELGIVTESATAVTGHRTAAAQINSTTQALEGARRYEADQRALLLAGAATPNDLLLAQRDLLAASLDWVNAFIAGRVAEAALLKAQGKTGLAK
ncbi:MAG: outer rane efflux protein [Myxococcaceae bacterium]|nr:outer rane efflux protein [Myxococcaceae bacterium]